MTIRGIKKNSAIPISQYVTQRFSKSLLYVFNLNSSLCRCCRVYIFRNKCFCTSQGVNFLLLYKTHRRREQQQRFLPTKICQLTPNIRFIQLVYSRSSPCAAASAPVHSALAIIDWAYSAAVFGHFDSQLCKVMIGNFCVQATYIDKWIIIGQQFAGKKCVLL